MCDKSDTVCEVCLYIRTLSSDVMQQVSNIFGQGTELVTPLLKGTIDLLYNMGGSTKPQKETVVKKSKELCIPKNGNGNLMTGILPFNRHFVRLAGISGAIAVGLGAYGAHVIMPKDNIPDEQKHSFRTANMYHFIGTFGLVAASLSRFPLLSGSLMAIGTAVFCGACYYHGLTGDPSVTKFAPYGGTTLIVAWFSMVL